MCGIAGYSGLTVPALQRATLLYALGTGIQARGRDAWGYAGHTGERTIASKGIGAWSSAPFKQVMRAARAETVALHARFGTHGSKTDRDNAHPFTIKRDEKIVLHGMHNGVLGGTEKSAKKHGRPHSVDSRELYELLADGRHDEAAKLTGYGLLVWVLPGDPLIRIMKLTPDADLYMVKLDAGGVVFGSTQSIVEAAIKEADMGTYSEYPADYHAPGFVMGLQNGVLYDTREKGFTIKRQETQSWESYARVGASNVRSAAADPKETQTSFNGSSWANPRTGTEWFKCKDGHWRIKGELYPVKHNVTWTQAGRLPLIPRQDGKGHYSPRPEHMGDVWKWGKWQSETGSGLTVTHEVLLWNDKSLGWYCHVSIAGSDRTERRYVSYHECAKCEHGKLPNEECMPCDEGVSTEDDFPPATEQDLGRSEHSDACKLHTGTDSDCIACWEEAVDDIIARNQFTG